MIKIRLQGTLEDIEWVHSLLMNHSEVDVLGISNAFHNKGTVKYYRVYSEIEKKKIGGFINE